MARTISPAGGNWSANGAWVEASPPANTDNVTATASSGALTADNAADTCADIDFTGYTAVFSIAANLAVKGSWAFSATQPAPTGTAGTVSFTATTTGKTITSAGQTFPRPVTINGTGGGWTLQDAFTFASGTLTVTAGAFHSGGKAITVPAFSSTGAVVRTVDIAGSLVTLGPGGTTIWTVSGSNVTVSAAGSTITCAATSGTKTVAGGGFAYGTLSMGAGANLTITGANSFELLSFTVSTGGAANLTLPASATTTSTTVDIHGLPGKLVAIASSSGGSAATLSVASGTVRFNHCSIKDLTCTGGATFEAYDCIDVSGNSGITFKKPNKLALLGVG